MLVVEDWLSRPNVSQKNKLWRRVLIRVLCGAFIVIIISDLSLLVGGGHPGRNNNTTQYTLMDEADTNLADTLRVVEELNRSERRGRKTFALKFCVFVTVLSYVANTVFEVTRADLRRSKQDPEGGLLACVCERNPWRLDIKYRPPPWLWL